MNNLIAIKRRRRRGGRDGGQNATHQDRTSSKGRHYACNNTFKTPGVAARWKARGASFNGSISEIKLATFTCFVRNSRRAGSKRPQREPTKVILFTITRAESSRKG